MKCEHVWEDVSRERGKLLGHTLRCATCAFEVSAREPTADEIAKVRSFIR